MQKKKVFPCFTRHLFGHLFDVKIKSFLNDLKFRLRHQYDGFADRRPSVLVLHDLDGWALDHVFELWFSDVQSIKVVRANWMACSTSRAFLGFDAVVFGYLDIYLRYGFDPARSIVVIHDPCELFPQIPDWKNSQPDQKRIQVLKTLRGVIVISKEMESILNGHGIKTWRVPTMSRLPAIEATDISDVPAAAISIFKDYHRKNAEQLRRLARRGGETRKWILRIYDNPTFNDEEYLKMIDCSSIYVCTSWQEGGPLPAMDVMSRGGVVITSPVGQVLEMITHGESGFICHSDLEFELVLAQLFSNPSLLAMTRKNSLAAYTRFRNKNSVVSTARRTLEEILQTTCYRN
jgi:glycosyltransferase involved in cell wall biosynthesis